MNDLLGAPLPEPRRPKGESVRQVHSRLMAEIRSWHRLQEAKYGPYMPPPPKPPEPPLILIGCGKTKAAHPAPARDLYLGSLFRARRRYAEASGLRWYIISARYGLLDPDQLIEPYDQRLPRSYGLFQRNQDVLAWARATLAPLPRGVTLEIHAGADYFRPLHEVRGGDYCLNPVARLGLGRQLAWYKAHSVLHPLRDL